jgi:hypothetical protein
MVGVRLAVALVNLESSGAWAPEALEQALRDHEIRRPLVTGSTCEGIRTWTRQLRPVFEASSETERCESINTCSRMVPGVST